MSYELEPTTSGRKMTVYSNLLQTKRGWKNSDSGKPGGMCL